MEHQERISRLRLIRTQNIGPVTFRLLLQRFGTAVKALAAIPEISARGGRKLTPISKDEAEAELDAVEKAGAALLIFGENAYPKRLENYEDAPICLSYKGHIALLNKQALAIVGARNASLNACRLTQNLPKR